MRKNLQQLSILLFLLAAVFASANAQSKQVSTKKTAARLSTPPSKSSTRKPNTPTTSLDLSLSNLGPGFTGHDVAAVFEAVSAASIPTVKSEFETTSEFESRQSRLVEQPLYGDVPRDGYFGFVSAEPLSQFGYDADSRILTVTLRGDAAQLIADKDKATVDGIQVRSIDREDSYIGSNVFGAVVEVQRTYSQEYGVAFSKDNWLFSRPDEDDRTLTYLIPMAPDDARILEADGGLLLVCQLSPPFFYHNTVSDNPTFENPNTIIIESKYLHVTPMQLWIFNHRTGDVLYKISDSSVADDKDTQATLRRKLTPLTLRLYPEDAMGLGSLKVKIDDEYERYVAFSGGTKTFNAKRRIVLTYEEGRSVEDLHWLVKHDAPSILESALKMKFEVNGNPYTPSWTKLPTRNTDDEGFVIDSITTAVAVP